MTSLGMVGARLGFVLLGAAALAGASPAAAQVAGERPDDSLSRNLRLLAANPKSLTALMGAGKAALELGDPQAALTFFARAEEVAPRDGRIRMWIGSALVQLQQPRSALRFFKEAVDLGVGENEVARERGLAHDIAGNPAAAQRDYRLALQRGRDDETSRRLALSLAIAGQREPALRLLEDQLLIRDPVAERTRALVLALTGDQAGAARAVRAAMPGSQGDAMTAFLRRLPQLGTTERALAVHLGVFPTDGRTSIPSSTWASSQPASGSPTNAGRPDPGQASLARRSSTPEPVSAAPRRRPGVEEPAQVGVRRVTDAAPAKRPPPTSGFDYARGGLGATVKAAPARTEPKPDPPKADPAPAAALPEPAEKPPVEVPVAAAESSVAVPAAATPQPVSTSTSVPTASRLAELAAALEGIGESEAKAAPPKAAPVRTASAAAAKPKAPAPAAKKPAPAPAEAARHWVQLASGADRSALPREFARLKAKAPKLFGTRTPWIMHAGATNRLLVGPFASSKEAQTFVNGLAEAKLAGFAWQSAAGQKIEKLTAK